MTDRRIVLDLALQHPEYRAALVRLASDLTAYSNIPTPEAIEKAVTEAGTLDGVDPTVAEYIVSVGLLDGEKGDDVVSTGKVSPMATSLHPSQKTMILAKAIGMALGMLKSGEVGGDLGAIISKDKHILDGHHRWAATILASGSKGKVGGYGATLPGKDLLKVLNILSKGKFKVRNGQPGKGAISDFKPENVRTMLEEFTEKGIGGKHPIPADDVKAILEKAFGSVEAGIDQMAENVKLMSKKVPGWAPDRKQMPVIDPSQVPAAAKALNEGTVDFAKPHAPGTKAWEKGAGHHQGTDRKWYVDTAFINKCQRVPGVSVNHMGFGEFYAETPKGRVDFDRMRGKKFEGQSGRSHQMYGEGADWLVKQVEKGGHSERMAGTRASSKALDKVYAMTDMLGEVRRGIQAQGHRARGIPEFVAIQKGLLALEKAVGSLAKKASMGDTDARAARIRLASTLPVGSAERKAILAGLQKTSGQRFEVSTNAFHGGMDSRDGPEITISQGSDELIGTADDFENALDKARDEIKDARYQY